MHLAHLGVPTFGQLLDYLHACGFTTKPHEPGFLLCSHLTDDSWFIFRDRERSSPARVVEMMDASVQLTMKGFVTEREFAMFWATSALGIPPKSDPA